MNVDRATTRQFAHNRGSARTATRSATTESVIAAIAALLDASGVEPDMRAEVLGGALVTEAVRRYWKEGRSAEEAHALLRQNDAEMADVIEAVSPMLLGRAQARADAGDTIRAIESLLNAPAPPQP